MRGNVLILVPDLNKPGGISIYFSSLKGRFRNWNTKYFTRGSRNYTPKLLTPLVILGDYLRYISVLLSKEVDVIHVNISLGKRNLVRDPFFISAARFFGRKTVLYIHGWRPDCESLKDGYAVQTLLKADSIIVLAEEFKTRLISWGYKGPIHVISTAVDQSIENNVSSSDLESRNPPVRILFLSRILKSKGIRVALDTFEKLVSAYPKLQLDVAGDGPDLEWAKEQVQDRKIPNVQFHGYITGQKKLDILKNSHLYFFPTKYGEGMPISLLEAMMCGMPVVTRAVAGLKDFFTPDMGVMSSSTDPDFFAEAIEQLINDPQRMKKISAYNYSYARKNFTIDRAVDKLENIYDELQALETGDK